MALYSCEKCGMSVGTMTCGHCGKELVHDSLVTDDGTKVFISKCPLTRHLLGNVGSCRFGAGEVSKETSFQCFLRGASASAVQAASWGSVKAPRLRPHDRGGFPC